MPRAPTMTKFSDRCETFRQLELMPDVDRHFALQGRAEEILEERSGILSHYIAPWDGKTKQDLLRSCKRRLQHVEKLAADFGILLTPEMGGDEEEADF